jgi:hypothetical protein
MAYIPDQQVNTGSFVPTTSLFDVSRLYEIEVSSPEFKELLVRLYQAVNNISLVLNTKDSAFYLTQEFANSQQFFNPTTNNQLETRPVFRSVYNIGALGAGATNTNHNLSVTAAWKFTRIYGVASNTSTNNYYPLPFAQAVGNNIELRVNATQILINNASGVTFTDCYVVLEYLKS